MVVNKKIGRKELNEMDFVQTTGATLRLVDAANHLSGKYSWLISSS